MSQIKEAKMESLKDKIEEGAKEKWSKDKLSDKKDK